MSVKSAPQFSSGTQYCTHRLHLTEVHWGRNSTPVCDTVQHWPTQAHGTESGELFFKEQHWTLRSSQAISPSRSPMTRHLAPNSSAVIAQKKGHEKKISWGYTSRFFISNSQFPFFIFIDLVTLFELAEIAKVFYEIGGIWITLLWKYTSYSQDTWKITPPNFKTFLKGYSSHFILFPHWVGNRN